MNDFNPHAPDIKYVQYDINTFCFSSSPSDMFDARKYVAEQAILLRLKSSLLYESFGYKDMIRLSSNIMSDNARTKGDQCLRYKICQCKNKII